MNLAELQVLAARVGFPDPPLAAAVAMAESHVAGTYPADANPGAVGDAGDSIGLWQIDTYYHPSYDKTALRDPVYNARAALEVSKNGADWSPWSTYQHGDYRAFYSPTLLPVLGPFHMPRVVPVALFTLYAVGSGLLFWAEPRAFPRNLFARSL